MDRIYLDHISGRPVDERVLKDIVKIHTKNFANPSSVHFFSDEARRAIKESRSNIAEFINAEKEDRITYTSGATESNNLAIKGVAFRNKAKGDHIITSSIEHMSVINTIKHLDRQGFKTTYLPVDKYGIVDTKRLEKEINERTILVSIMYANGEIGTIQPIKEIGEIVQEHNAYFHVDAVAALGQIPIDVQRDKIDLLTLSSNDIYGPKGIGALYVRTGTYIQPIIQGGGQERGLRSGTENLPGIVGIGKAAYLAKTELKRESKRLIKLRDEFINDVLREIPESYLNGHPTLRLPNNINIRFSYIEGESLILSLDMEGIACSSGSACTSKTLEPSHVLLSIGLKHEEAHGALLFTLGKRNTEKEISYASEKLPEIVKRLRKISPLTPRELIE